MADPEKIKATLEAISADLARLRDAAQEVGQSLLAFMLDQAKLEADNQLRQYRN
jgi:hypothetical protein